MRTATPNRSAWRRPRAGFFSAARLAMQRAAHTRWLLLIVALGIIIADVLICTVPLYNTLVSDLQLQNAVTRADVVQRNMQVSVSSTGVNQTVAQQIDRTVQREANQYLASFTAPHPTAYVTGPVLSTYYHIDLAKLTISGGQTVRLQAFDYTEIRPYLHLIQGSFPQTPSGTTAGKQAQVMVTRELADVEGLRAGQRIMLATTLLGRRADVAATISGIFEPINENDPFWNGFTFQAVQPTNDFEPTIYPMFTTADTFYSVLSGVHATDDGGDPGMTQSWIYHTELNRITTENMAKAADDVIAFRSHLSVDLGHSYGVNLFGDLDKIIANVQQQLQLIALPLYVIAAQIVGLALLFVAAMAALLIEQQSEEIATLKSRGASGVQMLGIYSAQSTVLGLLAALLGPFLAVALALLVIRSFLPDGIGAAIPGAGVTSITGAYLSRVAAPSLVIVPALIGAVLGIAVVTFYAMQAARLDVLALRRESGRPTRQPFWRRSYLDVGLALLCVVGYLELGQFGAAQTRLALGAQSNSPLLLLTPALLLLAGGLLLLRVIPLVARVGVHVASRGRGLTTLLAFSQIERTPNRYTRMVLLLVLAVGLGVFALNFDAALSQNTQDHTAYAAGADIRLTTNQPIELRQAAPYLAHLKTLPGIVDATPLFRTNGRTPVNLGAQLVDVLAVDSTTFAGVVDARSWRADYASQSLPDLMGQITAHRAPSPAAVAASYPLSVIISDSLARKLRLHVGDRFHLDASLDLMTPPTLIVSAIVHEFPTLYPTSASAGFLVMDLRDLEYAYAAQPTSDTNSVSGNVTAPQVGPNEFWLRTISSADNPAAQQTLVQALTRQKSSIILSSVETYSEDLQLARDNPITAGMSGLLVIGAIIAALLAVLGSLAQAVLAARQRTTQFAVLRTLGMANRQIGALLLGEQAVVYLFGLVGGTLLGLLLTTAITPFLSYSDVATNTSALGIPPYILQANWSGIGLFYGALAVAFVLALAIAARYAATIGLGRALRLGKD